jgi:hypothetical protein
MMKKILIFLLCSVATTGCSWNKYSKPGSGDAEFSTDYLQCQEQSKRLTGFENDEAVIRHCLKSKGWTVNE